MYKFKSGQKYFIIIFYRTFQYLVPILNSNVKFKFRTVWYDEPAFFYFILN